MSADHDPRVYFAAERTLLAWVRTGIAVIGLGFVVARFGLFLRMSDHSEGAASSPWGSTALGVALVVLGAGAILIAAWQHFRFARVLERSERPAAYWTGWPLVFAAALGGLGLLLAVYLLLHMTE